MSYRYFGLPSLIKAAGFGFPGCFQVVIFDMGDIDAGISNFFFVYGLLRVHGFGLGLGCRASRVQDYLLKLPPNCAAILFHAPASLTPALRVALLTVLLVDLAAAFVRILSSPCFFPGLVQEFALARQAFSLGCTQHESYRDNTRHFFQSRSNALDPLAFNPGCKAIKNCPSPLNCNTSGFGSEP